MVRPGDVRARDAALLAPLPSPPEADEDDDWEDDEPDAVLPQAPQQRTTRQNLRTARSNSIQPGHLICGECGQGNTPTRRFCSRCGSELSEAEVARTLWWHRLRPRRGPRVVPLGTGTGRGDDTTAVPGSRVQAFFAKLKIVLALLVALGMVAYASSVQFREAVDQRVAAVRKSVVGFVQSQYSPVRPAKVTATQSSKGYGPENTIDLNTASYWAGAFDPENQNIKGRVELNVQFDGLVSLNQLIVTPGTADAFTDHGRPRALIVEYSNRKKTSITLLDSAKTQKFPLP
ncbi:zinc ribbon domain-containing protein, partial [Streptomyces sp. WAC02707]|uniref:NADase-type glycan-binding domain-containing protein n=1 Tax=Streptomyces sp. WAC02707 TaxID=2487417 RepID=UPI000FA0849C